MRWVAALVLALLPAVALAQDEVVLPQPIVITSAGQSADATVLSALLRRASVDAELVEELTAGELGETGTLLMVLGASQKALGAAGIDSRAELARLDELLSAAEEAGIVIVGVHIGGEGRRGPLSEPFIEAVAGRTNLLVVTAEGNADGYFNGIADAGGIPLILLDRTAEVAGAIAELVAD